MHWFNGLAHYISLGYSVIIFLQFHNNDVMHCAFLMMIVVTNIQCMYLYQLHVKNILPLYTSLTYMYIAIVIRYTVLIAGLKNIMKICIIICVDCHRIWERTENWQVKRINNLQKCVLPSSYACALLTLSLHNSARSALPTSLSSVTSGSVFLSENTLLWERACRVSSEDWLPFSS